MRKEPECRGRISLITGLIDSLNDRIGKAVSWCTLALVISVTLDVVMRYGFNISFVCLEELHWHIYAVIFLLGAGFTLKDNAHVRVDVIYQRLGKKARAVIDIIGVLLFLLPGCFLVIETSIPFIKSSWFLNEGSPDPGGLPARYVLKAIIPIAFSLVALQGISMLFKNICLLFDRRPAGRRG